MQRRSPRLWLVTGLLLAAPLAGSFGGDTKKDEPTKKDELPKTGSVAVGGTGAPGDAAPNHAAKKSAGPGLVEIRFVNGSIAVMTLLQDRLDIVTEYGKLAVPASDIRVIEFGIHYSADEQRKLDDAVKPPGQ